MHPTASRRILVIAIGILMGIGLILIGSRGESTQPQESNAARMELIVVPGGGGQRDASSCSSLPTWVKTRLDKASLLYAAKPNHRRIVTLSLGTPHRPNVVNAAGFPIPESVSSACYLHETHAVPWDAMLRETTSLDTIGNAYFLRTTITDPMQFRSLIVVTSDFHMKRARRIFEWVFQSTDVPSPLYRLDFVSASDPNMPEALLAARQTKEAHALAQFERLVARLPRPHEPHFLQAVASFVNQEHQAYSVNQKMQPHETLDPRQGASY